MKRRELITLLGGAAAWPLAALAQQMERMRRVGILTFGAESDQATQTRVKAFRDGLQVLGWSQGRNIQFIYRWAAVDADRRRAYATELVNAAPDVILSDNVPITAALQAATRTIPIVFGAGGDPVASGLVTNLARPGGNVTGFSSTEPTLGGKWLELLKELSPSSRRVGIVHDPENPLRAEYSRTIEEANARLKLDLTSFEARDSEQIERDLNAFGRVAGGSILVLPGGATIFHRQAIIAAAMRARLPAVYPFKAFVESGGLMFYGSDNNDTYRRAASYVDRILHGERAGDLPVQQPVKFELIINLKTAKALGLEVPPMLLARADEVIA